MDIKEDSIVLTAFRKILRQYAEFQSQALKDYNLSPNEATVLSSLCNRGMASDIAVTFEVSKALVSRSVRSLREKGYIEVSISTVDKREQVLALTEEGERIAKIIAYENKRFYDIAFKGFGHDEKQVLYALLRLVLNNLNEGGIDGLDK